MGLILQPCLDGNVANEYQSIPQNQPLSFEKKGDEFEARGQETMLMGAVHEREKFERVVFLRVSWATKCVTMVVKKLPQKSHHLTASPHRILNNLRASYGFQVCIR